MNNKNKKQQYKSRHKFLSVEYVLIDNKTTNLVADFKTAKEAHEYKQKNPNTTIYIIKTFKY